jgi:hypothetical protein
MSGCCTTCAEVFDEKAARRDARRYRRRGLDRPTRRVARLLTAGGVADQSILEIGGGVGALQLELLRAGARHATNLELASAYEPVARELLGEAGFEGRVDRRLVDIAVDGHTVGPADTVVLNRVVCCYPDARRLVGSAADHARLRLVLTYPPRNVVWRLVARAFNLWMRVRGRSFRAYVHAPAEILAAAESRGLRRVLDERVGVWRLAALERPAAV